MPFEIHEAFDLLAAVLAVAAGWLTYRWRLRYYFAATARQVDSRYFTWLAAGSVTGAFFFGTLNLYLSGIPEIGRSILGSVVGATCAVETYKVLKGVRRSTGYIYIVPFCVCVIVGRFGCFFAGIDDHTFGVPTRLPWGCDFGDGLHRHPVQLYESFSMALFLSMILVIMRRRTDIVVKYGYYLCMGFYAIQRATWESLKPYRHIAGPFNLFQLLCFGLFVYSATMIWKAANDDTSRPRTA